MHTAAAPLREVSEVVLPDEVPNSKQRRCFDVWIEDPDQLITAEKAGQHSFNVAVEHFRDNDKIWARLMLQVQGKNPMKPQNCLNQLGCCLGLKLTTEAEYNATTKKRAKQTRTEQPLLVAQVHEATEKFFEIIKNMNQRGQFKRGGRKKRAGSDDDTVTEGGQSEDNIVTNEALSKDDVIKHVEERNAQLEHELEQQQKKKKRARVSYGYSNNSDGDGDSGSDSSCIGDNDSGCSSDSCSETTV
eukprot:9604-Heterococcus_DN1.PRE.11